MQLGQLDVPIDGGDLRVLLWGTGKRVAVAVHAMTIDHKYQVPSVAVHTDIFERAVRSVARVNGMPRMRYAFVPQPVMGKTIAELAAYVRGKDPVSGRPVMQEVVEALTTMARGHVD